MKLRCNFFSFSRTSVNFVAAAAFFFLIRFSDVVVRMIRIIIKLILKDTLYVSSLFIQSLYNQQKLLNYIFFWHFFLLLFLSFFRTLYTHIFMHVDIDTHVHHRQKFYTLAPTLTQIRFNVPFIWSESERGHRII